MERLTEHREGPLAMSMWAGSQKELQIYNRLAAYEDTGLTPEEVKAALRELERYRGLGTAEELNEAAYNASL